MSIHDIELNDLRLLTDLQPTGWGDIIPVYEKYIQSDFCFPIKMLAENKIVGIGTAIMHNNTAWLAHIIVHPQERKKGIGLRITQTLVNQMHEKNCLSIQLIATDLGGPVYEKAGFTTETEYLVFKDIKTLPASGISENIIPFNNSFRQQVIRLDQQVSGEDRIMHFDQHLLNGYVYSRTGTIEGFYLPDFGEGLIVAATTAAGDELMQLRLQTKDYAVFPADNLIAKKIMYDLGYKEARTVKRMRLGEKINWRPKYLYNRIGGNLG